MALYGSTIPLNDGQYVTTVICPNAYSHSRLMQALNNIVPEAAEPVPAPEHHAIEAPMPPHDPIYPEEPALRANPLGRDEE